jgi:glycosyltransferase involved in cell wall biosynthesis
MYKFKRWTKRLFSIFLVFLVNLSAISVFAENPKISVIIPVYNSEPWLEKCILSVLAQTMPDLEIICVNDGSTDRSKEILESFAKNDPRMKVIIQENKGASAARNTALDIATGEWIAFVDSDDYLDERAFETILGFVDNETDVDVVVFGAQHEEPEKTRYWGPDEDAFYENEGFEIFFPPKGSFMIWDKLYKRELIQKLNVRFDTLLRCTHDTLFNFMVCPYINRFGTLSKSLYYHTRRPGGLVKTMTSALILNEMQQFLPQFLSWMSPLKLDATRAQVLYDSMVVWVKSHSGWSNTFEDCDQELRLQIFIESLSKLKDWIDGQILG